MKYMYFILGCLCIGFAVPAELSARNITEPIDFDSVATHLTIKEAAHLLSKMDYRDQPELIKEANKLAETLWVRAFREDFDRFRDLGSVLTSYLVFHEQFAVGERLFQSLKNPNIQIKPSESAYLLKYLATFENKLGYYQKSIQTLNHGLKLARDMGDNLIIRDYYHHLTSEYSYLVIEDPRLLDEFQRLNQLSLDYSRELKDSFSMGLHIIQRYTLGATIEEMENTKQEALSMVAVSDPYYEEYKNTILQEYSIALYKAQHYRECIQHLRTILDAEINVGNPYIYAILARCFIEIGDRENAQKYGSLAKEYYIKSADNDRKRITLSIVPRLFEKLNDYRSAYYFADERDSMFRKQFITSNSLSSESQRFHEELEYAQSDTERQKKVNSFLWIALGFILIIVIIIVKFSHKIRNQNKVISAAAYELEKTNNFLKVARDDMESFAYTAAHDVKNPLHSINGFLQLIKAQEEGNLQEDSLEYFEYIERSILNLTKILNNIVSYAKVNSNNIEKLPIELDDIYQDVRILLHETIKNSKAELNIIEPLPLIRGSRELLTQLFMNLISNAIKYGPKDTNPVVNIRTIKNEDSLQIDFEDNGIGIPESGLEAIFKLFDRAENAHAQEGTGVGLAVAKKIMTLHRGKIAVKNNVGKPGATFSIFFPIFQPIVTDKDSVKETFEKVLEAEELPKISVRPNNEPYAPVG